MKLALSEINEICTQLKEFGIQWICHSNKINCHSILEIITQKNEIGTQNVNNVTQLFLTRGKKG